MNASARPSYGRRSQDFPRQCTFIGTTNADAYLQDDTNRRFWPVKVGGIDLDGLRHDVDQLWAEAVAAYEAGEKWWLDAEVEAAARAEQAKRRIVDVWEEELLGWAERRNDPFTVGEALADAVKVPVEKQDRAAEMRVATTLKANGWERFRRREGDRLRWLYRRSEATAAGADPDGGDHPGEVGNSGAAHVDAGEVGHDGAKAPGLGTVGNEKDPVNSACSQRSQPNKALPHTQKTGAHEGRHGPDTALGNRSGTWERREHPAPEPDEIDL